MVKPRRRYVLDALAGTLALAFLALSAAHAARAGEHRYDVSAPQYRDECGSCHVPYPPALLSAAQWRQVMNSLQHHYGTDASVDAAARDAITRLLVDRSGRAGGTSGGLPRISTGRWFVKEHREASAHFKRPAVKGAADCGACHRAADGGDYSERSLVLPH